MKVGRQAVWFFIFLVSCVSSAWLFITQPKALKLNKYDLLNTADIFIDVLTVTKFDSNGGLVHYLETPFLHHIPAHNTYIFKMPHIIVNQANKAPWDIRAQQAVALNGGQKISLKYNVIAHQAETAQTQASTLRSESMTYFPKKKIIISSADVVYSSKAYIVSSKGMKADLVNKHLQLLAQAKGAYDPAED